MSTERDLSERFIRYLQAFAVGQHQAQTAVTICAALGLEPTEASRRTLRAIAQDAPRRGHLVCSCQRGYYVPMAPQEVLTCTRPMRAQAGEMWDRAKLLDELAAACFELPEAPEPERPGLFALLEGVA